MLLPAPVLGLLGHWSISRVGFDFSSRIPSLMTGGGRKKKSSVKIKILLFSVYLQIPAVSLAGLKGLLV